MKPTTNSSPLLSVQKLGCLSRDPQAWIAMLALVTLLGLGTGSFEPTEALELAASQDHTVAPNSMPSQPSPVFSALPPAGEQVASLDARKL
ncbi:hypothetical protein WG899_03110 [Paucibacter sp. AS339]|uniref:hypothetical protein n=1 Tax=Paucibacter hankyongi TaxID=3133434 RepID=UPI0030956482